MSLVEDLGGRDVHYPAGAANHVFEHGVSDYILDNLGEGAINVSFGSQPNSSPHFGTLSVMSLSYALAESLGQEKQANVYFEVVDTAPGRKVTREGVLYQKSVQETGHFDEFMPQYKHILDYFSEETGVPNRIRTQSEFNKSPEIPEILESTIENRDELSKRLDPKYENLRIRVPCPECGLTDKHAENNEYRENKVISLCPDHGEHEMDINEDPERAQYNTPLRNLVRGVLYGMQNDNPANEKQWLRVTGKDYAGFYQEELLHKTASMIGFPSHKLPMIMYTPLVTDWSGAKLSKTLYVEEDAYSDLPEFIVNFENFYDGFGNEGLDKMLDEARGWVQDPKKLFRNYSAFYFVNKLSNDRSTS